LLIAEGIRLKPDIVTFNEGNNDAGKLVVFDNNFVLRFVTKSGKYLMIFGLLKQFIRSQQRFTFSPEKLQKKASAISANFIENISKIHQELAKRGIIFLVASQQKHSQSVERKMLKGFTYKAEVKIIQTKLSKREERTSDQIHFLIHSILMQDLQTWANSKEIPFVDVIARLDQDRDVLVRRVHLSPEGNRKVAEAFADEILKHDW